MWLSAKPNCNDCGPRLIDIRFTSLRAVSAVATLLLVVGSPLAAGSDQVPDFGDISFDDSMFDDSSLFEPATGRRFEHFTFRLSHQLLGHVNRNRQQDTLGEDVIRHRQLETNRLGLNFRYQNPVAAGWLVQASGHARLYLPGDYEHREHGLPAREFRVNELYLQRSSDRHSLRLGRQTVVWGETIGNSVLDVINTTEFRDLTIIDIEDARLNQWLVNWDYYSDNATFSSFVNLYPDFSRLPPAGSPLRADTPWQLPGRPESDSARFEAGTRWSRSFTGSDVAIMAAYLYENDLHYLPPAAGSRAQAVTNDYRLIGFSANRAIGRLLLTMDLAYSHGVLLSEMLYTEHSPVPEVVLVEYNKAGSSVGFEYGISNTQQISLSVAAERYLASDHDTQGNVLLRYSNSLMNENLLLSVTAQTALDGDAAVLGLDADYRVDDRLSVTTQLILTRARSDSLLYRLDQDIRAGITFTYAF